MTSVNDFIIFQMLLQGLNNLDAHLQVVLAVAIDQLTNILSFRCRLSNDRAIVAKQMTHKVLVKISLELLDRHLGVAGRMVHRVNIDLLGHVLAHLHQVCETVIDWTQSLQHDQHVSEEHNHLVGGCIQNLHD